MTAIKKKTAPRNYNTKYTDTCTQLYMSVHIDMNVFILPSVVSLVQSQPWTEPILYITNTFGVPIGENSVERLGS